MQFSVMYRTPGGNNVLMQQTYRSLEDAEECVVNSFPWLNEEEWQRGENSSIFNLSDGSCFIIYKD